MTEERRRPGTGRVLLVAWLLVLSLAAGCSLPGGSGQDAERERLVAELQESIQRLSQENASLEGRVGELSGQLEGVQRNLAAARGETAAAVTERDQLAASLTEAQQEIARRQDRQQDLEQELERTRELLAAADGRRLSVQRHELEKLPEGVRAWADLFREVNIGAARTFSGRTYLLVTFTDSVQCCDVVERGGRLIATATANRSGAGGQPGQYAAVASVAATDLPVDFELREWWLPHFRNPHGLPGVRLPAGRQGVLVEPKAGAALRGVVRVAGYAARLFEGTVVARLVDDVGTVLAEQATVAAGGMGPDWGSFALPLDLAAAKVKPGRAFLEIGDYSPKDGTWTLFHRIEVEVRS